ncbi:hypothetical protein BGX23_004350, partial [Mortierella sp. AD031]
MTTLYPKTTLLSRAIAAGYPPGHAHSENHAEFGMLWAFAVTSQNAVSAVEAALRNQPDTGATLACVQRAGFKNINPQDSSSSPEPNTTLPTPSPFENAAQLVDFLIALKWPTTCAVQADDSTRRQTISVSANDTEEITDQASFFPPSVPELWFLTGETRMKTLAEKLSAHQRAFREVVVYETGPRPGFEEELSRWLADTFRIPSDMRCSNDGREGDQRETAEPTDVWLVGFSPKGIDLTVPVLKRSLESRSSSSLSPVP